MAERALWPSEKLVQHIYILIGVARACHTMAELRQKMAEMHGKIPVQLTLYIQPMPERKA